MAALDQFGTTLLQGASTLTGYVGVSDEVGGAEVVFEDVDDEDGALKTRIMQKRLAIRTLELIPLAGTVPTTDFPIGQITTVVAGQYVEDCKWQKLKGAHKVSVTLKNLGIT